MPTAQSEDILEALRQSAATLRDSGIEFALGGGLAARARGGPPTEHDIDLVVRPADTEPAILAFRKAGLPTGTPPEGWLVKTWWDGMLVDLISDPIGLDIDDGFFARCDTLGVAAVSMLVMPLDDVFVGRLPSLNEHNLDFEPPRQWAPVADVVVLERASSRRTARADIDE